MSSSDRVAWGLAPRQRDVCGNGKPIDLPPAPGSRWGRFLSNVAGLQRLSWTNTWGKDAHMQLHRFNQGPHRGLDQPQLVWESSFPEIYSPLVVLEDIDSDGQTEVAVSMWHGVVVHDAATGKEKYRCKYRKTHSRQYGFFCAHTDPSGKVYLVVVGDFAGHAGVLAVRDGQLKNLWVHLFDRESEQGIDRRQTINTIGPDPVGDFNGDGQSELLMNVFNESFKEHWHLLAYDIETGEQRLDLPDVYLHGCADLDGDGTEELLTQECPARPVATNGQIRLYEWDRMVWQCDAARWSMAPLAELPTTHDTGATRGREAPVVGNLSGRPTLFFTSVTDNATETLHALQFAADKPVNLPWSIDAPDGTKLTAVGASEDRALVRARYGREALGQLDGNGVVLENVAVGRLVRGAPQPVVLDRPEKMPLIVVADPMDRVGAWVVSEDTKGTLQPLWARPGRAMTTSFPQMAGLTVGDLDGDATAEVLCVQETADGTGRLVSLGIDGTPRWHKDLPGFGGRAPIWNECGVTRWALGHFLDANRLDVLVSMRRSIMHSDETMALDGRNGDVIWHRDLLEVKPPWTNTPWPHTRGYGGGPVALADFNADRLDDVAMHYPCEYSVINGRTGEQLLVENTGPLASADGVWIFGANVLAGDFNGDGRPDGLCASGAMLIAFAQDEGRAKILWRTEHKEGGTGVPALADLNGDGLLEIGVPGCPDGFRCFDAATGQVRWTIPSHGGSATNCVAVDINGDGREEFIYGSGRTILAVGASDSSATIDAHQGHIVWTVDVSTALGCIVVADVDADQRLEVLAGGNDGTLYCVEVPR